MEPMELVWHEVDGELRAELPFAKGLTVCLARPEVGGGWALFGAFIPDGAEPWGCASEEDVKDAARQFWASFLADLRPVLYEGGADFEGAERLSRWFGLSYAGWLTLPRVMMEAMPGEWQRKMAELLETWDAMWTEQPDMGTRVQAVRGGRFVKMPEFLQNYRRPDGKAIEAMRPGYRRDGGEREGGGGE